MADRDGRQWPPPGAAQRPVDAAERTGTDRAPDSKRPDAPPASIWGREHRRLTAGIVITMLLVAFEAMAVATAMPVAVRELHGLAYYAWGFSAFLATSLFGMVVGGEVSDARGPRAPVVAGASVFAVGLLIAGTAIDMAVFVLGRAVQGFGAGVVIVALYVVVARAYPDVLQPQVFAAMAAAWVLPSIVGPVLAGWATESLSWRAVFLSVAPGVALALLFIRPAMARLSNPPATVVEARPGRRRLALAASVGAALVQYAEQRLDLVSIPTGLLGAALLGSSVPKLLPRGTLVAARGLPTAILVRGMLAGAFFGAEGFLPLMLVSERGLSPTLAGASLTGAAIGWALGSWYQGRPATRIPRHRIVAIGAVGVTFSILGAAAAAIPAVPVVTAAIAWVVGGAGMGMALSSLSVLTLALSAAHEQGVNSAALQISDALGSLLLIGLAGAVFAALHRGHGHDTGVFLAIDAVMATLAAGAVVVASRLATRTPAASA